MKEPHWKTWRMKVVRATPMPGWTATHEERQPDGTWKRVWRCPHIASSTHRTKETAQRCAERNMLVDVFGYVTKEVK